MATLTSPRQSLTTLQGVFTSPRQSLTTLTTFVSPRQSLTTIIGNLTSCRQSATSIYGATFAAVAVNPSSAEWLTNYRNLVNAATPSLTYAGIDLTPILADFTLTAALNGKATAEFTLGNPSTNGIVDLPSPLALPGSGTYANKIRQHDGTTSRRMTFTVAFAGQTWTSETMMPTPPAYDGRWLKWGGEDYTAFLDQPPATYLPDIIKAAGDSRMAHAVMRETALAASMNIDLRFPDYRIGEYRRGSGTVLSHLDALAKPMQAGRRFENSVLVYEQVDITAPVQWRFVDRLNIRKWEIAEYPRAQNSFTMARLAPAGGQVGEKSGGQVGRNSVSFTASREVIIDIHKVEQGRLDDWIFFSESGAVLSTVSARGYYNGPIPASKAEFTYYPNIGATAYTPGFDITVRGEEHQPDPVYSVTASNSAHIAAFGSNPAPIIADAIVGDATAAQLSVDAYCQEATRKVYRGTLETPYLNPFIRVGHRVAVTDYLTAQSASTWVVEQVKFAWSGRAWSMMLELSRGL